MNVEKKDNVRSLSEEKYTTLSEQNGWSLAFAEGYVSGETERRRGNSLSSYVMAGVDHYALGFRAGYFERPNPVRGARRADGKPSVNKNIEIDSATVA